MANRLFPPTLTTTREVQSGSFSVINRLFPSPLTTSRESQSPWFTVLNRSFPLGLTATIEAQSQWFSLLNSLTFSPTRQSLVATPERASPALSLVAPTTAGELLIEGQTVVIRAGMTGGEVRPWSSA